MKRISFLIFVIICYHTTAQQVGNPDYSILIGRLVHDMNFVLAQKSEASTIAKEISQTHNYNANKANATVAKTGIQNIQSILRAAADKLSHYNSSTDKETKNLRKISVELTAAASESNICSGYVDAIINAEKNDDILYYSKRLIRSLEEIETLLNEARQYASIQNVK